MANQYHQLSLKDTFSDCKDMFMDDVPSFFQLLEQHFDISLFIPQTFYNAFYQPLGRKRDYPLTGFLSALILQKIFPIPTDSLLILLLNLCRELRDFCGFSKVPDPPLFTRFKLGFADHIELMFQQMVDYTEPICQQIDSSLAQILTFDTSGIYVNSETILNSDRFFSPYIGKVIHTIGQNLLTITYFMYFFIIIYSQFYIKLI